MQFSITADRGEQTPEQETLDSVLAPYNIFQENLPFENLFDISPLRKGWRIKIISAMSL